MTPAFARGLMFHRFRDDDASAWPQGAITAAQLERVLLDVGLTRILAPDDWIERARHRALRPTDVCLTFDDGLRSQMEIALPVLERLGLRAFWFVYSCVSDGIPVRAELYSQAAPIFGGMHEMIRVFIARCPADMLALLRSDDYRGFAAHRRQVTPFYEEADLQFRFLRNHPDLDDRFPALMAELLDAHHIDVAGLTRRIWISDEQLAQLHRGGHCLGLHSYDHPYDVSALSPAEQERQYVRNARHLTRITGVHPSCVAHPLNAYSDVTLEILRGLGITCGFRADVFAPPGRSVNASPLELARADAADLLHREGAAS